MLADAYRILNFIASFQFLFFSIFLLSRFKFKQKSNFYLALVFISRAICISIFHVFYSFASRYFPNYIYVGCSLSYLFGPALYFYTLSTITPNFSIRAKNLVHTLPALAYFLYNRFVIYNRPDVAAKLQEHSLATFTESLIMTSAWHFLVIVYIIAALFKLKEYRSRLKETHSSLEKVSFSWLKFILAGFLFVRLVDLPNLFSQFTIGHEIMFLNVFVQILEFLLANLIVFKALTQPEIFAWPEEQQKYKKSSLSAKEREKYLTRLKSNMEINKPFLTPSITIRDLAQQTHIPVHYLSQILNETLKQNFFDFINTYRIREAQLMLIDPDEEKNILQILYEVGFNSKSTFNDVFKKCSGITPSEFKRQAQSGSLPTILPASL